MRIPHQDGIFKVEISLIMTCLASVYQKITFRCYDKSFEPFVRLDEMIKMMLAIFLYHGRSNAHFIVIHQIYE